MSDWFSLQLLCDTFLILRVRRIQPDIINVHRFFYYSCKIVIKLEIYGQIFEHYSNIKFHENSSIGERVLPCGQTDITKLIVVFRNFANAPINYFLSS